MENVCIKSGILDSIQQRLSSTLERTLPNSVNHKINVIFPVSKQSMKEAIVETAYGSLALGDKQARKQADNFYWLTQTG